MILKTQEIENWPPLAWVGILNPEGCRISAQHGPKIETNSHWLAEAVWAGDFKQGDFDQADLITGSGIRVRDDHVTFVSSGTAMDHLWYCNHNGSWHISNSLPCLLAVTGLSLRDDYHQYVNDIQSINCGRGHINQYVQKIPSTGPDLQILYLHNLVYDGRELRVKPKPDTTPPLSTYGDYYRFLTRTTEALGRNASSPDRKQPATSVATISSGYDAAAVSALARHAGCKRTVTIRNATSIRNSSDSGKSIADRLDLQCDEYTHTPKNYRQEEYIWAATGQPRGLNYTVFEFPEPLTLLFTGNYGEMAWDLGMKGYLEPASDLSGLCLSEYRLAHGIFHCIPAYWGIHHLDKIRAISHSTEMQPWRLGNSYDRPIPRRILEDAGVPRELFGMQNMNTSSHTEFWWPYSPKSQASFRQHLRKLNLYAPGSFLTRQIRWISRGENLLHKNLLKRLGFRSRFRPWRNIKTDQHLFQWANHELKQIYVNGLKTPSSTNRSTP